MTGKPDRANPEEPADEAPPNGEAAAAGAAAEPQTERDAETARADENWDRYLRTAAELENVRKRAARDVEHARKFALERFATELLAVKDSLEMGLAAANAGGETANVESLLEGSRTTLKQLAATLERFGVAEVDPEGEPFDPTLHEAMTTQPSADVEPGTVLAVYQKGYTLNGRLLRPARVVVAAAPQ
jgi:molecular chaperone GrpE